MPELPFQLDQLSNHGFVSLDSEYFQLLTCDQNGYISGLLAGDRQLMKHLNLHVFGNTLLPESGTVDARCLALQDLYLWVTHHLTVKVGQHPMQIGVGML